MTERRALVHLLFLFLLPVIVAWFGWSVPAAIAAVLLMLVWRWLITLSTWVAPEKVPAILLETISASHFVEKVRWNMDVAGLDYTEKPAAGTLGASFLGRTVPRLKIRTGAVRSQISNSPDILRYLWGAYRATHGDNIKHLEPTRERIDLEKRLDRCGTSLQVWAYHHLLEDRELALHVWGANAPTVPIWQRAAIRLLFPLQALLIRKSFRITPERYKKACQQIEELLGDIDTSLADGRVSILGDDEPNYTDYAFAAMMGLWLQPAGYGGGAAEHVRIERSRATSPMRADIERWVEDYPRAVDWVQQLYAERRQEVSPKPATADA